MQMRAFACLLQAGMACTGSTCGLALKKPIRRLPLPPGCRDFSEVSIGPVAPSGLDRLGGKEIIFPIPNGQVGMPSLSSRGAGAPVQHVAQQDVPMASTPPDKLRVCSRQSDLCGSLGVEHWRGNTIRWPGWSG